MKYRHLQTGFTLMEVMFAVAILAIGLVFLACQFPVGMFAARDNVDQTRKVIETHNSQVMMEVQLSIIENTPRTSYENISRILDKRSNQGSWRLDQWGPKNVQANKDITQVHFLPKPNVYANRPILVLDDPEGAEGYVAYLIENIDLDINLGSDGNYKFKKPPLEPEPTFWSHHSKNELVYGFSGLAFNFNTDLFLGDIGRVMSPPVDETDPKVQEIIRRMELDFGAYNPLDPAHRLQYLHPAIFEVSLESNYSWAAFYHEGSSQYYLFTLRNPKKEVRYAVQDWASFYYLDPPNFWNGPSSHPRPRDCYGEINNAQIQPVGDWPDAPAPGPADADRVFPVPWRVCLGPYSQRYLWYEDSGDYYFGDSEGASEFPIPKAVADILRPGSILIDADPADNDHDGTGPLTTRGSGHLYEVSEVYIGSDGEYWVRLRTGLHDDLHYFWVFPPPIDRATGEFDDWQPVISVTKKVIDFN